jgi:DNA-binding response OmpR family regulator
MQVLVVEDDEIVAASIGQSLREASFDCDYATDGETAAALAVSRIYDLIVLDILLPRLNGYQVCARVRQAGVNTPILMLTAKVGEWDQAEGLDGGADDYLTKPVSSVVLLAHLRALLRRSRARTPARFVLAGIMLDPVRRICSNGSKVVALSGREVEVLAQLMSAGGGVVHKGDLVGAIWGEEFEGDPNIVEVYVGHLRKKLDRLFGHNVVETVHGLGYRLRVDEGDIYRGQLP